MARKYFLSNLFVHLLYSSSSKYTLLQGGKILQEKMLERVNKVQNICLRHFLLGFACRFSRPI